MRIVRVKQRSKRTLAKSTLQICDGMKLAVGIYSFIRYNESRDILFTTKIDCMNANNFIMISFHRPAKPPKSVNINKRTNAEVERTVNEFRSVIFFCLIRTFYKSS